MEESVQLLQSSLDNGRVKETQVKTIGYNIRHSPLRSLYLHARHLVLQQQLYWQAMITLYRPIHWSRLVEPTSQLFRHV